jgi:hypothetical protein
MSRSFVVRAGAAVLIAGMAVACGGYLPAPVEPAAAYATVDRMTVRTGEQAVIVDSPVVAGRRVERMVLGAGGYLERSSGGSEGTVRIVGRVPAQHLDSLMDGVAALGKERRRYLTEADVSDQYTDLEARLRSNVVLRDRLQELLARATTLDDALTLEKQISRLQTDIDALQARIDQLKSRVELASLDVSLERKRVLGPLAVVGQGVARLVSKLFVIR